MAIFQRVQLTPLLAQSVLSMGTVADNNSGCRQKSWSNLTDLHILILSLIPSHKNDIMTDAATALIDGSPCKVKNLMYNDMYRKKTN